MKRFLPYACLLTLAMFLPTHSVAGRLMMAGGGPAGNIKVNEKSGVHIPRGKAINFNYVMTDGAGYTWDLQYYGTIGQGSNYAYAGGLYLQVNNNNFQSNGQGWLNQAGDEVELGPWPMMGVTMCRRVKVYKDAGLARWLDIFENPGTTDIQLNIQIYTNTNYGISRTVTDTGGAAFANENNAFITESSGGANVPNLLHVVCDKNSKLRPTVQVQSNYIYVRYTLKVPAGKTAILCYFESQNTTAEHQKNLKSFRAAKFLRDLPSSVRKMIVNFGSVSSFADVEVERNEASDAITLTSGDPILGTVSNDAYNVQTFFGPLKLDAKNVIGWLAAEGEPDTVRFVLADGQVVCGKPGQEKVVVNVPASGELQIPMQRIRMMGYKISDAKPVDSKFTGPFLQLRSGDRLLFDAAASKLKFRTRYGLVDLDPKNMLEINMDNPGNGMHRAQFLNTSVVGGFLEPSDLSLTLKLGQKVEISRDMVARLRFAPEDQADNEVVHVTLTNSDELFGKLVDDVLVLKTDFGTAKVKPGNIKAINFPTSYNGRVIMQLWNNTVLRGQLDQDEIAFQVCPGTVMKVPVSQFQVIECPSALPAEDVVKKVEELVARLGAESFKDRQTASDELEKMGKSIAPILIKHLRDNDPEVRHRVQEVLDRFGGNKAPATVDPNAGLQIECCG